MKTFSEFINEFGFKSSMVFNKDNEFEEKLKEVLSNVKHIFSIDVKGNSLVFEVLLKNGKNGKETIKFDTSSDAKEARKRLNTNLELINANLE